MKILALYFSGTGNTKFVVDEMQLQFAKHNIELESISIEDYTEEDAQKITDADCLLFANPIYGSMAPMIMWRFVKKICPLLVDKKTAVIATQLMFSGDGGAYLARILRKCHAEIISIEHFFMPSNLVDVKMLKVKNDEEAMKVANVTRQRVELYCADFANNIMRKRGDGVGSLLLGAMQRVPFSKWEKKLSNSVKISESLCIKCSKCVNICPMDNLQLTEGKIAQEGKCTLCYRCVNQCPQKAISIMSKKKPLVQYRGVKR